MNEFLAKSNPIETIQQHTNELIKQYNILKEKYPHILKQTEWELLYLAALYHDFGKMNVKFQNKISKAINNKNILKDDLFEFEEIPHNYISPAFLNKQKIINEFDINSYKILILAIFFHHARRPIVVSDLEYIKKTIEFIKKEAEKFEYNNIEISVNSDYLKYILGSKSRLKTLKENWNNYFKIKGLLNRLDYVASSGINEIEENIYDEDNERVMRRLLDTSDIAQSETVIAEDISAFLIQGFAYNSASRTYELHPACDIIEISVTSEKDSISGRALTVPLTYTLTNRVSWRNN